MEKPKTPGRARRDLSAARIASEALKLIDAQGLEGFSFRALAKILGCEAMSLYHWFPSKQHLFDALVALCLDEMAIPATTLPVVERLRLLAHEYRKVALRHPGFLLYLGLYRMNSRRAMVMLDVLLRTFEETGLSEERASRLFRVYGYYVVGAGLDEAMGYAKGPSSAEPISSEEIARDFPSVMRAGKFFGQEQHLATFDAGLDILLQQVAREMEDKKCIATGQ